ncbi:hypothetical protein EG352_07860 [Chryseobacterium indologenes]|uniref:Uncharacterized protein n=1 Tax=Chryseobacterium indologenes TaxID=253 RepID=A0AAD0YRT3_CHRID|nr:hypothetical protein EG352_07860 [Chryseobacterium indologenes]
MDNLHFKVLNHCNFFFIWLTRNKSSIKVFEKFIKNTEGDNYKLVVSLFLTIKIIHISNFNACYFLEKPETDIDICTVFKLLFKD